MTSTEPTQTHQPDPDKKMTDRTVPFFAAVSCGDLKKAEKLLKKGVSPNFCKVVGDSETYPLLTAVVSDNPAMVRLLLCYGAKKCGRSPHYDAIDNANYAILKMLLDHGVNDHPKFLGALLHYWARSKAKSNHWNYEEIGRLLLENGADPLTVCSFDGVSPLWIAAEKGNLEAAMILVKFCKERNCFYNLITQKKESTLSTPLYMACQNGHRTMVKYLLEIGADPDARTLFGFNPLFIAIERGFMAIVQDLLTFGVDIEVCFERQPSYDYAFDKGHVEIGDLLWSVHFTREQAWNGQVRFLKKSIENDTLVPYAKQWLPFLSVSARDDLFGWMLLKMKRYIIDGIHWAQKKHIEYLPYEHRHAFFKWVAEAWLLQKATLSPVFSEIYNPVSSVVASFLVYPDRNTHSMIDGIYREYDLKTHPYYRALSRTTKF